MAPTMAPTKRFANHPGAKEAPASALVYRIQEDKNPCIRGLPLVAASLIIGSASFLQKLLWKNAKFGEPKDTPGLEGVHWRIQPNVIPLADSTSPTTPFIPLTSKQQSIQPPDLAGRFYSAADYYELYRTGKATPLQVAEALLPLIRRDIEPQSKYAVAFTQTHVDEVLAAAKASTERWAAGMPLSILDGVPFGVKDDVDVKGFVSTMGMKVREEEEYFKKVKESTAWPALKMIEAGAVMMGKMNQHEVGMGTATNWYNTKYFPGGSSSGAGSALSGGLLPIAVGTDAGGSVRIPTAFCGVYGLKTTHNRTCSMSSSMCVVGPMAATVPDLTIAYRIMSQPNPDDPGQNLLAVSTPPNPTAKKYIGLCHEWLDTASPEVINIFDDAVNHLTTNFGYEAIDIQLPFLRQGQVAHAATCLTEAATDATGRTTPASRYLSLLNYPNRILVGTGAQTPGVDYLRYGQIRTVIMQHLAFLFEKYPGLLVLTPTSPMPGWPIHPGDEKYGNSDGNLSIKNMTFVWYANTSGCPAVTCPVGYLPPKQGEGNVPVGLMAMGEWGAEEQLLAFAKDTEGYLSEAYPGGRQRPKEWVDLVGLARERAGKDGEE
ncbi:hypothetical protein N0V88_006501 [Collariella sp. IMI 366227]|nr:hypothetical protein N0V88_006501 [Collariella sp. IMI 366227]